MAEKNINMPTTLHKDFWPYMLDAPPDEQFYKLNTDAPTAEPAHHLKSAPPNKHAHYFKDVSHLQMVDVYRVLNLFGVTDPCIGHAVKKLLVAGGRGTKPIDKDIAEAIISLQRWQQMRGEDCEGR